MTKKKTPPSIGQFALSERDDLLATIAEQAREIERLLTRIAEVEMQNHDLIERFAPYEIQDAMKAKPGAVVMPEQFPEASTPELGWEDYESGYNDALAEVTRLNASRVPEGCAIVARDWLKHIYRDLDSCQKVIWANMPGCDPSYYKDAQARLAEIDAMLSAAPPPAVEPAHSDDSAEIRRMLARVTDELDALNCAMRDQIDDDMAEPEEEVEICDATDELIDEARALLAEGEV
jgi:hypothetical protein